MRLTGLLTPNCWLIWTSESVNTWYARLRKVVGTDDVPLVFPAGFAEYESVSP